MADYVFAVHDFAPEHEDEISFKAGERIEVLERDDLYSDGWWQGRNAAGQTGLFPQSYTSPNPPDAPLSARTPTTSTMLHPLAEADEDNPPEESAVMAATLTDIQEAIDQLGSSRDDNDAGRSFSFASTKEDSEDQLSEGTDEHHDQDDAWRADARRALAERAQREMERREAAENAYAPRESLPPIDVEMSDESEDEEDHTNLLTAASDHMASLSTPRAADYPQPTPAPPPPPEEPARPAPAVASAPEPASPAPTAALEPSRVHQPASPLRSVSPLSDRSVSLSTHVQDASVLSLPTPSSDASHSPRGSTSSHSLRTPGALPVSSPASLSREAPSTPTVAPAPAPAPAPVSAPAPIDSQRSSAIRTSAGIVAPLQSKPSSRPGSGSVSRSHSYSSGPFVLAHESAPMRETRTSADMTALPSPTASSVGTWARSATTTSTALTTPVTATKSSRHPSEWSVDEVVAWLRSKGFDDGVCAKFIEHEITGDVLLDLDANLLKELDIVALGKRMRIANAIHELQRPPSIVSSENSGRNGINNGIQAAPHTPVMPNGGPSPVITALLSPESPPHTGDIAITPDRRSRPDSEPSGTPLLENGSQRHSLVGLGFSADRTSAGSNKNGRPAMLNLSPSDSQLKARAALADQILEELGGDDDRLERVRRDTTSDGEGEDQRSSKRKSSNLSENPPMSASVTTPASVSFSNRSTESSHKYKARSVDVGPKAENGHGSGRLSFFGGTLSGKSRKPPPRVSMDISAESLTSSSPDKSKTLSRLHFGSSSKRPQSQQQGTSPKELVGPSTLRKRTVSTADSNASTRANLVLKPGMSIVDQIGEADYSGWMRKRGERYNTWKLRYFVLKGPHLYYLRSRNETKLKGYINIVGYKVIADENANPGRYGFRIVHDTDKTHYFSSEEQMIVREWMKAIMKATIDRDYTRPVISSCNIPTIPLTIAQAMNPAPRPPSPGARDATQRAMRRENPNQLSTRDARVLMGLPSADGAGAPTLEDRKRLESFFSYDSGSSGRDATASPVSPTAPPRPKRDSRKPLRPAVDPVLTGDAELIKWVNSHLPEALHVNDLSTSLSTGLVLFRLAEAIKGAPSDVPDSVFPSSQSDDRLEGLFKLFDFMLDNDVKTGSVSINDVRQGQRDKIVQLVRSLKGWEDKRLAIAKSVGVGAVVAGPWVS